MPKDEFRLARVNGRYFVVWYEGGRRQRRALGTTDKAIGLARLSAFVRKLSFERKAGESLTMTAIYDAYVADREIEGKAAVPRMRDAWKRLSPTFGALSPMHINKSLCRSYTERRRKQGVGDGTIHVELGYLRAALRFAKREEWITAEPTVPLPRKPPPQDHHLSRDEAARLIDAAGQPHIRLFIILALTTAARAGAILDLTWSRVDLERRMIRLSNPDRQQSSKGRATVPVNDLLYAALNEARNGAISDHVIEWAGGRIDSVKKGVSLAAERCGLRCSPHVLRHTAAVHLAEDGHSMDEIAQFLGHSNPVTTYRIYARYSPHHLRRLGSSLEYGSEVKKATAR